MSQTIERRGALMRAFALSVFTLFVHEIGYAQTTNPEDEYKKLVTVDEEIKPSGDTPFGESINLFDGGLSFQAFDISVPGNGPTIQIGRTFQADGDADIRMDNETFGDWDIELPRFSTMTPNVGTALSGPPNFGWVVDTDVRIDRCTHFRDPPDIPIGKQGPGTDPLRPSAWWNGGYLLRVPGAADQHILSALTTTALMPQMPGLTFTALSKSGWRMACLPATSNGQPGEAFLAVGADGTKYWLNYLVYRQARGYQILRRMGYMLATRVEDRFGHSLTYSYADNDSGRIVSIAGDDGRLVTFGYTADGKYISQISVVADGTTRTWTYGYAPTASGVTLTSVRLPDGSQWTYDLSQLTYNVLSTPKPGICLDPDAPDESLVMTGAITAPSGLHGTFEARPTRHGRSGVYSACESAPAGQPRYNARPRYVNNLALRRRVFSGAGVGTQQWLYDYPVAVGSWLADCNASACDFTSHTDLTDPAGNVTRYTFSNRADVSEGKPLRTDYYSGAVSAAALRTDTFEYADPARGPWPVRYGGSFDSNANTDRLEQETPLVAQHIYVDGDVYNWQALDFDSFARATSIRRSSSAGFSVDEKTSYLDDAVHWVVGLPASASNLSTGEEVGRNVYEPDRLTLTERYRFGRRVMRYSFDGSGQLASFTDENNHITTLSDYKRGIPQLIGYPDGTSRSYTVDGFGQVTSATDQAGSTTSYSYNEIGRLSSVAYPAGDAVAWNRQLLGYALISASERGIDGPHWRRSITQGDKVQMTYFDAMLRPVITDTYRSDGAIFTSARTDYDWKGRRTFQSYPYDASLGVPGLGTMDYGVLTRYDALGRITQSFQHSELGDLLTSTEYLSGIARRVTDPKGSQTTTWFQAFDEPAYDEVVKVVAPEGIMQTIQRDLYGNPLSISQGGITKTMTYDGEHRLCRTWEPESGSEITAYDNASNVAWTASGVSFDGSGCGQDQVSSESVTVMGYDAMNRVTSVRYPSGTQPSTLTYDPRGNLAATTSGTVGWTFGRNKRGLLTAEVLSVDGWSWALGYGYDANASLSTVLYPSGDIVQYNPDALGRATSVGEYASNLAYFPDGDVKSYALGNGGAYFAKKNDRNLLSNFTYGKDGSPTVSEDFDYDTNGNLSKTTDVSGSTQRTKILSYDALNRLVNAYADNLWGSESYTYDSLNNITTLTNSSGTRAYNYDLRNLLVSITSGANTLHVFSYDARGNTTNKDGQAFNFDQANRLTSISGKGQFVYDAAGRRVKREGSQGATYYAYDDDGQLMWEMDPATRLGTGYVYLGKKLLASTTENIDVLKQNQVSTSLSIVGVPHLSLDGKTVDVMLDIGNNGKRTLTSSSQYPVQVGYHLIDGAGASTQPEGGVNLASDISPGGHGTMTLHVAAPAVLGTGVHIHISLLQNGVAWFQDWPNNATVDAGPYSACPTAGTGNLCNNVTGLTRDQVDVTLTMVGVPTLSADGQSVLATLDVANNGKVTLASAQPHPVNLGNHIIDAAGNMVQADVARQAVPEIAPGQHASVTISTPSSLLLGNGCGVQFELAQEGIAWFSSFGSTPVVAGPYATLHGETEVKYTSLSLTWDPIAGATSYNLRESANGSAWATIQSSLVNSWSTPNGWAGTYGFQLQACGSSGCAPWGDVFTMHVIIPPSTPDIGVPPSSSGSVTINWGPAPSATSFVVEHSTGSNWTQIYSGQAYTTTVNEPTTGTYYYRVMACNANGCSPYMTSAGVTVTIPPTVPPSLAGGGTSNTGTYGLSWTATPGATYYNLMENINATTWTLAQQSASQSWSAGGRGTATYYYMVQGCNASGCTAWSNQAVVNVLLTPATPERPSVSVSGVKITVKVTWPAVAGATRYELQETNPYGHASIVSGGAGTIFTSLRGQGEWSYIVRACNDLGCSAWSPPRSIYI